MADENGDMPETVANEIARIRKHFEEFGEHRLSDAHFTIRWLADRLEQAERDTKNECIEIVKRHYWPAYPLGIRIPDAIITEIAASLPTPKQGDGNG